LAAATHNLLDGKPAYLERCVYYDGLSEASVEKLRVLSREMAVAALQEINRQAMTLQQQDIECEDADQRMTFGVYFYDESTRASGGRPQ
jgi:hypothetical protein